jgi:hypothetical protein
MYEHGTLKSAERILRRGRKNNGWIGTNWGTLNACLEVSQQNPCTISY